jgi:pSer/pThr/pTyr-binding forkhead associated (FHA) protein
MASLVLSFNGEMVQEYEITKPRISIGRRPHHDIAIDNLAVSGDHAALVRVGNQLILEDGGSTNGTKVNGQTVEKHPLKNGDVIEIGKYHLKYFEGKTAHVEPELEKTMLIRSPFAGKQLDPEAPPALDAPTNVEPFPTTLSPEVKARRAPEPVATPGLAQHATLKVLNGKQAGAEIPLTKPLTTIGKKGVQVAIITRHHNGYFLNHVQGQFPIVNGATINDKPCPLSAQDVIEFRGVKMRLESSRLLATSQEGKQ